ncbi:MAG: WGR domain-containing protein [Crinalium sp.]
MKLIKRTTLSYQEGTSDKIYEVDLCQLGENSYIVNFRYGRRGSNLKEGSKTVEAVSLLQAQPIFDKLVNSKIKSGYQDITAPVTSTNPTPPPIDSSKQPANSQTRTSAILQHLANPNDSKWNLSRVIWRAGELKISEATPHLIKLLGTGDALQDYCIAWALGWCGGKKAISELIKLYQNSRTPEFVSRIAFEAILKLSDNRTRLDLQSEMIEMLPEQLKNLARDGSAEDFTTTLRAYLNNGNYQHFTVLDTIYRIDNQYVRPALIEILKTAPFKPNYFKYIRHIFKMAEYRHDAEVFSILTYRFENEKAMYYPNGYPIRIEDGNYGRYLSKYNHTYNPTTRQYDRSENPEYQAAIQGEQAQVAYSNKTREYLLRRLWRTLKQLGEEKEPDYIKLAVSILLQYSDQDAKPARKSTFFTWNPSNWSRNYFARNWDTFAGYRTFNHILYENSPRYILMPNSKAWRCVESYKPGDAEPEAREEAFPELWQQHPQALLQLLLESNCRPVHHFAVKAIRACQSFLTEIDLTTIIKLINQPYPVTVELGVELVREKYQPANPNLEVIFALINCCSELGRNLAYQWIEAQREQFLEDSNFIANLVTSHYPDTRSFARRLLSYSIIKETTAKVLIGRIITALLALESTTGNGEIAKEIGETLLISFTPQLRHLGFAIILDLLAHPLPEVQEIGARILLNHETQAIDLPSELIESLLNSPYEAVRNIGVSIFSQLPEEMLLSRYELLVAMLTNQLADMRSAIRPVIQRLAIAHPNFATQLATQLINVLIRKEKYEGIHTDVVRLLQSLSGWMSDISKQTAIKLLNAQSSAAKELGGVILTENSTRFLQEFTTSDIVKLANHEILSVRQAARKMFLQRLDNIRTNSQELLSAVRILESKWEDTREFSRNLFSEFSHQEWTPEVMISICDSIREDVRQFGRNLVTRNFQANYGQDYLLKFSEHPSADMQLFASNYLENYAANHPERLQQLTPYFITILSQINRSHVAKQRIFNFLATEAQKSETAAQIVAEIMTRQSVTIAIADKAKAIQTMLKIKQQYPHISLPLQIKLVDIWR